MIILLKILVVACIASEFVICAMLAGQFDWLIRRINR
jgi:hypothetical protein